MGFHLTEGANQPCGSMYEGEGVRNIEREVDRKGGRNIEREVDRKGGRRES